MRSFKRPNGSRRDLPEWSAAVGYYRMQDGSLVRITVKKPSKRARRIKAGA